MDYSLQIQKLLLKRKMTNNPDDRISLIKQAINTADAHNDAQWGFDLRLDLIRDEKDTSRCDESFPAFAWILDTYDKDPDSYNEDDFLWEYKWMLGAARRNSAISLEQIESIGEDYKKRLKRNDYSLRAYYAAKTHLALSVGDVNAAKEAIDLRDKEARDNMSNCHACELDDNVEVELLLGNFDKALSVGSEMLTKKVTCAHMPFACYATCVKHFHKKGDMEKAFEFFKKAENDLEEMDDDSSQVVPIAEMTHFLSYYDEEKAWQYFEKYADWNIASEQYFDMIYSMAVLPLLSKGGTREMNNINSGLPWYRGDGKYDITELYNYYYNTALDLAKKFDTRNGNEYYMTQLRQATGK